MYAEIFQREIKNMSNSNKSLKEILKEATKNRLRNATMVKSKKPTLVHLQEMVTWCLIRQINISVVEPLNEFTDTRKPTVP